MDVREDLMRRCFDLAQSALGFVRPNPLVGALLVQNGKVVAEGFHQAFGGAHAEVNALNILPENIAPSDCTMYVNLEPCSHFGKTPPCADIIIAKGIKQVVISNIDPDPRVSGRGIERLKANGIQVISGVLENEGAELNRRFFCHQIKKRPYIILKWAQSADGFMDIIRQLDQKGSFQISQQETKKLVHLWRSQEQAILIGSNTLRTDNPQLNLREVHGIQPIRLVISRSEFQGSDAGMFNAENPARWLQIDSDRESCNGLLKTLEQLGAEGIQSILVEGGLKTHQSFLDSGLWDEIRIIRSETMIGKGIPAPALPQNLPITSSHRYGKDRIDSYRNL